jgi:FtsH-binding integral membrane protein
VGAVAPRHGDVRRRGQPTGVVTIEYRRGRMEATYPVEAAVVARPDQPFLTKVFGWMFVGLTLTGGVAALIGSNEALLTDITETPGILIGVVIGQLVLVIALVAAINRLPVAIATLLFLAYSATVGITFAFLFELYTAESIFTAFLVTAGMFGALAVFGAITDIDLSKVGAIAFMALIGLILATIVNIFWASETLYWITTYAGVLIFSALTAYDMQKLTQISKQGLEGQAEGRAAIIGALSLYLDFINLFIFLLRIFGRSR